MAIIKIRNAAIDLDAAEIPNIDASKITTGNFDASRIGSGTFADARIAASNVSQHATSFDDNKIVNDISTLGLRVHTQENLNASNSNSASFDVFQDSSAISNLTNVTRNASEFISSIQDGIGTVTNGSTTFTDGSDENHTITSSNSQWSTTNGGALGGGAGIYNYVGSNNGYLNIANTNSFIHQLGSSDFTIEFFQYETASSSHRAVMGYSDSSIQQWQIATNPTIALKWWASNDGSNWNMGQNASVTDNDVSGPGNSAWSHCAVVRSGNNFYGYNHGSRRASWTGSGALNDENSDFRIGATGNVSNVHHGYIDQIRISNTARYTNSTYTIPSGSNGYTKDSNTKLIIGSKFPTLVTSATGSFTGNNITASSSTNKIGAVITYQDNAGTNALNTDIILQLSADGGSNYSTATMTALPDFATGIKMAKVNDLSVTAGTQLKYKISFANQASGSKEARIRGVSLQY